jgi:class 3 adenylate cyclase
LSLCLLGGLTKVKYELIGEAVEMAEQIQSNADPGSIYISSKTAEFVKSMESKLFELTGTGKYVGPEQCILLRRTKGAKSRINLLTQNHA